MKIIVIVHEASEGMGTLEDFLAFKKTSIVLKRLYANDSLPNNPEAYDAIVTMGGPMNAFEDEKYPFLQEEVIFLRQAIDRAIPILGICLGAQMIARACGASVYKAPQKEVGWSEVGLTEKGEDDMLFRGVSETLPVLQWHEDTFDLPVGGHLLATSLSCPNQAFRYFNAYGLQFHVEVTPQILSEWFGSSLEGEGMICRLKEIEVDFIRQALRLYNNFFNIAHEWAVRNSRIKEHKASIACQ